MAETTTFVPRCVQRTGRECRDCVECLSKIPDDKTCGDCVLIRRCVAFGITEESRRFCDFVPSYFRVRVSPGRTEGEGTCVNA